MSERDLKKPLIAGGVVAGVGAVGLIGWGLLHKREIQITEEEILEIFLDAEHPDHVSSVRIMGTLFTMGCVSFDELHADAYGGINTSDNRELGRTRKIVQRQIDVLHYKNLGDLALVDSATSAGCRAVPPLSGPHYEATNYAAELRNEGKFGDLFKPKV